MKKLRKVFIAIMLVLSFLLIGSNASAIILDDWTLDLDAAVSGLGTYSGVEYLNFDSPGSNTTTIRQYLGADNTLNNGDTFVETGYMQLFTLTAGFTSVVDLYDENTSTQYALFAYFDAVTGSIHNYDDKGTVADNTDDTWDYTFDSGSGTVGLYLDTNNDPTDGTSVTLLTADIIQTSGGSAVGFMGGASNKSSWALTLEVTNSLQDVFLDKDGNDLFDLYGANNWLRAYSQGDTELDGPIWAGYDGTKGENFVEFTGHTGDTMKIGVVPEPATMLLLGSGLLGLAGFGRKKKFFKKD